MSKIARSARGVMVDFDILEIKQQMASTIKPMEVSARQSVIDAKLRRKAALDLSRMEEIAQRVALQIASEEQHNTPDAAPQDQTPVEE